MKINICALYIVRYFRQEQRYLDERTREKAKIGRKTTMWHFKIENKRNRG